MRTTTSVHNKREKLSSKIAHKPVQAGGRTRKSKSTYDVELGVHEAPTEVPARPAPVSKIKKRDRVQTQLAEEEELAWLPSAIQTVERDYARNHASEQPASFLVLTS